MANNLSEKELQQYKDVFAIFDKNGDGQITAKELGVVMRAFGQNPSDQILEEMVKGVDKDNNGVIDWPEFLDIMLQTNLESNLEEEIEAAFKMFDQDSNGFISTEELRSVLTRIDKSVTVEEINAMIRETDTDGDGLINYEEFAKMMRS